MMYEGRVSIVIPTYNSLSTLDDALYSVLNQTYRDIDIIVVDDGSTDGTAEYLESHPERERLHVIHQENAGAAAARNTGLKAAKGEFVLFVDSDVVLYPILVRRMVLALAERRDVAFVYCDFVTRQLHGSWRPEVARCPRFDADSLRQANYISCISLVRRDLCPQWDPRLRALDDWDLWLTLIDSGHKGLHIPEVLFETIDREESITQSWDRNYHVLAMAAVRAKHVRVMLVVSDLGDAESAEAVLQQVDASRMGLVDTVFVDAGQSDGYTQTLERLTAKRGNVIVRTVASEAQADRAVREAITAAARSHDWVVFLDGWSSSFRPYWLYELIRLGDLSLGRIAMSFGGGFRAADDEDTEGAIESSFFGHRLLFGPARERSFAAVAPAFRGFRFANGGTKSLAAQVFDHFEGHGAMACSVADLHSTGLVEA